MNKKINQYVIENQQKNNTALNAIQPTPPPTGKESTTVGTVTTPGVAVTTDLIVRYVNCFGEENYGIRLMSDPDGSGMIQVYWDEFTALLKRLGPNISAFDKKNLGVHIGWVRAPMSGPNNSFIETLPLKTNVLWNSQELKRAHSELIQEEKEKYASS